MKRAAYLLAVTAFLLPSLPVQAQDALHSPAEHLEFARKLRDKGYLDLAMEHLEEMRKQAPPGMQQIVSFEIAKTRLQQARALDPEERLGMVDKARAELQEFLKKNPDTPEAAIAKLDLRRLASEQGLAVLSLALRERDVKSQQAKATEAENYFRQAHAELDAFIKTAANDAERNQARFDQAVNMMDLARTYINTDRDDINLKRVTTVDKARELFEALKSEPGKLGFLSRAWLIKCWQEAEPGVSEKYYDELKVQKSADAIPARRLADYFQLVRIPTNPLIKKSPTRSLERYKEVQVQAKLWLKVHPAHNKTPIGYGVRYELANALFQEALLTPAKDAKRKKLLYAEAQKIVYSLNEQDNDFVGKVAKLRANIARVYNVIDKGKQHVNDLPTFELCCLRAGEEYDRVQNFAKQIDEAAKLEEKKALDKKLRQHLFSVVLALSRALAVADARTPRYAVDNARRDLLAAYLMLESPARTKTPYRTAVCGDALARLKLPNKHGPLAAECAIDAYARILTVDPSPANRERLRDLALFVLSPERLKAWDKEQVVSLARFHLALLDQNEATALLVAADQIVKEGKEPVEPVLKAARDKFQQAVDQLQKMPRDTPTDVARYFYAQGQAVFLALDARDKITVPGDVEAASELTKLNMRALAENKKFYQGAARKLVAAMPPLPAGLADPGSIIFYFRARVEESKFLYEEAAEFAGKKEFAQAKQKYLEMANCLGKIDKELSTVKLETARLESLNNYVGMMRKYASFGIAEIENRAGEFDKVLLPDRTGHVVAEVKKLAAGKDGKDPSIRLEDYKITGQILGLAMRAGIHTGKIDEARDLMKILRNLKDVKESPTALVDSSTLLRTLVLRSLVAELDAGVQEMKRGGKEDKLKKTVANFTAFLDALVKQADKKAMDRIDLFFLARCYDVLDQHGKAAQFYGQYPAPACLEIVKKDKERFSKQQEEDLQYYWYAQVMLARQLRLAKKLPEAKKILDGLAAHKNPRQLMLAEKEQICLLEENNLFGTAITRWNQYMKSPALQKDLDLDLEKKKTYFDAYYHLTYCRYKYSQSARAKTAKKEAEYLARAVDSIIQLENSPSQEGWQLVGHKFRDLLRGEPVLNQAYVKKKGG